MQSLPLSFVLSNLFLGALAASANDWRSRSIYQIIVDRYALPAGADTTACDPGKRTWCGGTWNTIREKLDYIQRAGFTAVCISPLSQNYQGPTTPYGDAYHGRWIADATKLNDRFGTSDDLKSLSRELHKRGMYLMVDVIVNDVMATTITPDLSTYMFKEESQFHPYCVVDWSSTTSEERCWLGDTVVPLADINTEDLAVVSAFRNWIGSLVREYDIDGLRIDAAKHVNIDFWPGFCAAAGVFCIGEVFTSDADEAAMYQGPNALDSVLHYPMYYAIVNTFAIPGQQNMTALTDMITRSKQEFKDTGLLGNFIENQDIPRWRNISVDPQTLFNAMIFNFMSDGIPIVYYGQEQDFSGNADPWNREPLWTSGYANTSTYQLISRLNQFRNFLVNHANWVNSSMEVLTSTDDGIAILKGGVITVLTNIGSPPKAVDVPVYTPYPRETPLIDVLSCKQWPVGSNGTIQMQYSQGGFLAVLLPLSNLSGSGLCGQDAVITSSLHQASSKWVPSLFTLVSRGILLSFIVVCCLIIFK